MSIGSLFSGYGGLDLAVESMFGASPAWFCEFEAAPSKVLAAHWPSVPNLGDITTVDWSAVEPVDIITGGSPCQDLSHAGKRAGMTDGTRSNLWVQMREAIAVLRPSLVVWENVRGALSADADSAMEPCSGCVGDGSSIHLRALGRVLGDLADLGYDCRWHGLRAADVGAPHGRFRVFVVAHRAGWGRHERFAPSAREQHLTIGGRGSSEPVAHARSGQLAWPAVVRDGLPVAGELGRDVADPACDRSQGCGYPDRDDGPARGRGAGNPIRVNSLGAPTDPISGGRHGRASIALGSEIERTPTAGRSETAWSQYAPAIRRWESALGRPAPAPTETGRSGGQRLSPRFVEWLMGLPDGWVTDVPDISRSNQLKMLGNGVVPQQAAAAISHMTALERAS